jgi:hypothetical protein
MKKTTNAKRGAVVKVRIPVRKVGRRPTREEAVGELSPVVQELARKNQWDRWDVQTRELVGEDLAPYIRLREVLAAFERFAVYYFLAGRTASQRAKRAAHVERRVRAFLSEALGLDGICPIGYCECDGMCLPCGLCVEGP